jgi:hypothetical protein
VNLAGTVIALLAVAALLVYSIVDVRRNALRSSEAGRREIAWWNNWQGRREAGRMIEEFSAGRMIEEFSQAAIACAMGWMAAGADSQLGGDYFARWATALLVDGNPKKFTFEQLTDFENEIRSRYTSAGLAHLAPSLAAFIAHNSELKALRLAPRPGDNARAADRPLYADECPECRQDPCVCRRR